MCVSDEEAVAGSLKESPWMFGTARLSRAHQAGELWEHVFTFFFGTSVVRWGVRLRGLLDGGVHVVKGGRTANLDRRNISELSRFSR